MERKRFSKQDATAFKYCNGYTSNVVYEAVETPKYSLFTENKHTTILHWTYFL